MLSPPPRRPASSPFLVLAAALLGLTALLLLASQTSRVVVNTPSERGMFLQSPVVLQWPVGFSDDAPPFSDDTPPLSHDDTPPLTRSEYYGPPPSRDRRSRSGSAIDSSEVCVAKAAVLPPDRAELARSTWEGSNASLLLSLAGALLCPPQRLLVWDCSRCGGLGLSRRPKVMLSDGGSFLALVGVHEALQWVVVAFRGSVDGNLGAWGRNLQCWTEQYRFGGCGAWIHRGWGLGYSKLRGRVWAAAVQALSEHPQYRLVVTGHSAGGEPRRPPPLRDCWAACGGAGACPAFCGQGGACCKQGSDDQDPCPATMPAFDVHTCVATAEAPAPPPPPPPSPPEVNLFFDRPEAAAPLLVTFASPMAGDRQFADLVDAGLDERANVLLRVVNSHDAAVHAPNLLATGLQLSIPCPAGGWRQYAHPGQEVWLPDASTASDPNPLCSSSLPRKSLTWLDHNTYLGVDSGACHDEPWPSATPLDGSRLQSGGGTYSYG
ncbi:hypothetical protein EMIHUDRAFT_471141 [Emiliania huxleyi CCMP1516]|uniref:Fungal lipase-type domain-containing protein n=2 Tax=Emiliania huxleyi TaxID=2903 RepID=A0A0D3I823_EMIH1|nr:hypothetical protein EMIHUDRAFT_471141 [Emiliania huxleyi CCMP1516]EOD07408.1 hypothetical protein EMIHUDRAFT_471141 [Emiliania huxleyi CCMP1516]|eukprot:XP_005759837.1 hypothetical protein EMIHUDRAFT_471141 [Emiliania huxleyi CCMP1516]